MMPIKRKLIKKAVLWTVTSGGGKNPITREKLTPMSPSPEVIHIPVTPPGTEYALFAFGFLYLRTIPEMNIIIYMMI